MRKFYLTAAAVLFGFSFIGNARAAGSGPLDVSVAYAHTSTDAAPNPWQGSPNVLFVGEPSSFDGTYDSAAIMVHNHGTKNIPLTGLSVSIGGIAFGTNAGTKGCVQPNPNAHSCDPWKIDVAAPTVLAPNETVIFTQTNGLENLDGSDVANQGTCSAPSGILPLVLVQYEDGESILKTYTDKGQVINTGGVDEGKGTGGCTSGATEAHDWVKLIPNS